MKKIAFMITGAVLLMSSCGTYTGQGAVVGGSFGAVLGSAIGGVAGGWRGSDIGTIVGMASGAAIGASVGAAADQQEAEKYEQYRREREARRAQRDYGYQQDERVDQSGYDATNSGDDRIDFDAPGPRGGNTASPRSGGYTAAVPQSYDPVPSRVEPGYSIKYNSLIEIRNARFIDADHDGVIRRGEECRVTFEIMNRSSMTLYDVQPMVFETSGNKHIRISPNLHVESIAPNSGVRYTATVLADKKLKDGQVVIRVAVAQGNHEITSQVKEFTVTTSKH
ncbi:MAG: hypothetical protein ILA25_05930 [Prevotella sp.]|nr:hypothetical protein [Prevotella sp.]